MSAIFGFVGQPGALGLPELGAMDGALAGAFDHATGMVLVEGAGLGIRSWGAVRKAGETGPRTLAGTTFIASARIDNREEITVQLRAQGAPCESGDDLNLLFAAYRQWGIAGLPRIAGSYAFAAWEAAEQRLILARSAIAAPPLHYCIAGDLLAFATMPRGLFAMPGIIRKLDRQVMAMNLIRLSGPDHVTLYEGIARLPTGSVLIHHAGSPARVERWWTGEPSESLRSGTVRDHAAELRCLMEQVIDEQRGPDPNVGILLSGGLDSAGVAALACAGRPDRRVTGFTHVPDPTLAGSVPEGWYLDETPLVQDLAQLQRNLEPTFLPYETDYFLDGADDVMLSLERHFSNIGNLGWMRRAMSQARERGINVMLTGVPGNFTASRSGGALLPVALARWDLLRAGRALTPRSALSAALMLLPDPIRRSIHAWRHKPWLRHDRPWRSASAINPAFADAQRIDDLADEWRETYLPLALLDERPRIIHALQRQDFGMVDHVFASLHGVELRNPLADIRIAAFCLSASNYLFHDIGEERVLIRKALSDQLPASILQNRKRGMQAADLVQRIAAHKGRVLEDINRLEASDLACEILDLPRMRRAAEASLGRPEAQQAELIPLLGFGLTVGRFLCLLEADGVQ